MSNKKLRPLLAVRKKCLNCCNKQTKEITHCPVDNCELFQFRFGKNPNNKTKLTLKTIRSKCVDCSAGSLKAIKECWDKDCPLYPFRIGKNPNLVGKRQNNIGILHDSTHQ